VPPWKRHRHLDHIEIQCQQFAEECAAFLEGRLVEVLEARKVPVPTWAWTNMLAHGSMEQLRLAGSEEHQRYRDQYGEWRTSRSQLANLMLASARSFGPLLALQQECALIPLELMLAAQPEPGGRTPAGWVAQVEGVLRLYRATLREMNLDGDPNREKGD
jgi:hypothetical protein